MVHKSTDAARLREMRETFEYAVAHGISMDEARRRIAFARWRARDAARAAVSQIVSAPAAPFQPIDNSDEGLKWFQR